MEMQSTVTAVDGELLRVGADSLSDVTPEAPSHRTCRETAAVAAPTQASRSPSILQRRAWTPSDLRKANAEEVEARQLRQARTRRLEAAFQAANPPPRYAPNCDPLPADIVQVDGDPFRFPCDPATAAWAFSWWAINLQRAAIRAVLPTWPVALLRALAKFATSLADEQDISCGRTSV